MRRILTVAMLAVLVTTTAACGEADDGTPTATASTGSPAAPSPTTSPTPDAKANAAAVCAKFEGIVTEANFKPIGEQLAAVLVARQQKNKTAETKATAKAKELADALAKQITDLKADAADPKLDDALDQAALGVQLFGSPEYLARVKGAADLDQLTKDFEKALEPLGAYCS